MSKKSRKRRQRRDETVRYTLTVTGWDYYYTFGPGHPRWDPGLYSELATLDLWGSLTKPVGDRHRRAMVTLSARTGLLQENRPEPAKTVGSLTSRDEALSGYVFVPAERLSELVTVSVSGRIKTVEITGTKLKWRQGSIIRLSITTKLDEE